MRAYMHTFAARTSLCLVEHKNLKVEGWLKMWQGLYINIPHTLYVNTKRRCLESNLRLKRSSHQTIDLQTLVNNADGHLGHYVGI